MNAHASQWDWLLNVTCNVISVIYVMAHRCPGGLKKLALWSGSQRHRHFVGIFNVPVHESTQGQPFYGYSEKPPHFSRLLRAAWGYGGPILVLNPQGSHWVECTCRYLMMSKGINNRWQGHEVHEINMSTLSKYAVTWAKILSGNCFKRRIFKKAEHLNTPWPDMVTCSCNFHINKVRSWIMVFNCNMNAFSRLPSIINLYNENMNLEMTIN